MRVTLIPAAGASSRMRGGDKLLEDVNGAPCLAVMVDRAVRAGASVIVTVPDLTHPRATALTGSVATLVPVERAIYGMSVSLKAGVAAVPDGAPALMILPGDMPDIATEDMRALWENFEKNQPIALQATTEDGQRGHPIVFSRKLLAAFESLQGDAGAYRILKAHEAEVVQHALPGNRARLDLDTPEDWARWRAMRSGD